MVLRRSLISNAIGRVQAVEDLERRLVRNVVSVSLVKVKVLPTQHGIMEVICSGMRFDVRRVKVLDQKFVLKWVVLDYRTASSR